MEFVDLILSISARDLYFIINHMASKPLRTLVNVESHANMSKYLG